MTKHLYVSTDENEAKYVIGYLSPKQFVYHNIDMQRGEELAKTLGFNPMGVIEFNDSVPDNTIDALIAKFSKEKLIASRPRTEIIQKEEVFEEDRRK